MGASSPRSSRTDRRTSDASWTTAAETTRTLALIPRPRTEHRIGSLCPEGCQLHPQVAAVHRVGYSLDVVRRLEPAEDFAHGAGRHQQSGTEFARAETL
jgi:hypothetical protein